LTGDLGHVLEASGVGATVDLALVPRSRFVDALLDGSHRALALQCLLAGGDDYELCFTAPAALAPRVAAIAAESGGPLQRVGAIQAGGGLVVRDERGFPMAMMPRAFDHFGGERA
jgi:thiamine-monophosphate kinase